MTEYRICYSNKSTTGEEKCVSGITELYYTIRNLQHSTKYFVSIAAMAATKYGRPSGNISKITNGGTVVVILARDLHLCVYNFIFSFLFFILKQLCDKFKNIFVYALWFVDPITANATSYSNMTLSIPAHVASVK